MRPSILHVGAAAAPALIATALVATLFDAPPTRFVPWWNDEVVYWNEIATFARAGFDGGYVAVNEQPPRGQFSRAGPHGPVFSVLYGLVARATGWEPYSAFVLNLVIVPLAALVWLRVRRPTAWTELALPAIFWPLLLLLPTAMQEPLHFAVAFLLAAATWRLLDDAPARRTWYWAVPLLLVAALMRPTWALMVLPMGVARLRGTRVRPRLLLVIATLAALAAAQQLFAYVSAPYPASVAYLSAENAGVLSEVATAPLRVWRRTQATIGPYLDSENGDPAEVALRYASLVLAAVLLIALVRARRHGHPPPQRAAALESATLALLLPLGLIIATGYIEGFRDFRILSPHLLYAVLVAAAVAPTVRAAWWLTLLFASTYLQSFVELHRQRFAVGTAEIDAVAAAVAPVLSFDPAAAGWGNTVLVHADLLRYPLLGLPRGLSVSYAVDWDDQMVPFRSRYLLLRAEDRQALAGRQMRVSELGVTPIGVLYRNLDAIEPAAPALHDTGDHDGRAADPPR